MRANHRSGRAHIPLVYIVWKLNFWNDGDWGRLLQAAARQESTCSGVRLGAIVVVGPGVNQPARLHGMCRTTFFSRHKNLEPGGPLLGRIGRCSKNE